MAVDGFQLADHASDFGVLVIDGGEASLAWVPPDYGHPGAPLEKIVHMKSHIASRTRRGGQSAPRFSRSRQLEELEFLRKVAARAVQEFSNVQGLVLGGSANMKYKLVAELPQSLRRRISCIVSLSCSASWTGLQKAASQVSAASKQQLQKSEGDVVEEFLKCIQAVEKTTTYEVCYGEAETARALEMGAVKQLLISDNCANLEKWKTRAISCGSQTTEIQSATDSSVFCKGYKIGAFLRWRMNLSMEEMEEMTNIDSESESEASTATPTSLEDTLPWLQEALEQAGYDETSVEALTIGVDVVLSCNAQTPEERFNDALQLLQSQDVPTQVLEDFCLLVGDTFSDDSFD